MLYTSFINNHMVEIDLSPCPFCGEETNLNVIHNTNCFGNGRSRDFVECKVCNSHGPCVNDNFGGDNRLACIKLWNMRNGNELKK